MTARTWLTPPGTPSTSADPIVSIILTPTAHRFAGRPEHRRRPTHGRPRHRHHAGSAARRGAVALGLRPGPGGRTGAHSHHAPTRPVPDAIARAFSLALHRHLAAGADAAEATRRAQTELAGDAMAYRVIASGR